MTSTHSSGSIDTLLTQAAPRQDAGEVLVRDYVEFVSRTDLSKGKQGERFDIAVYGLVGEIGSLVAAIKKRLLAAGRRNWGVPNPEIIEELGDSLWYCFAVAAASGLGGTFLAQDIEALLNEVGGEGGRSERIRSVLGERADAFLKAGPGFLAAWKDGSATLDDYRRVAFLTSRTQDDQLVEVSLAVLQQLTAELLRRNLPEIEKDLNRNLMDRSIEVVLGETIWHMAALASLYGLELSGVAQSNMAKLERRFGRGEPTPLYDDQDPLEEQFPRRFDVAFVPVGPARSRMYRDGRRLGDDLTDNAYREDGYRFHDVMHLALVAKLGWSPVLRKLMGRKRRSNAVRDEVEDGARAQIVEEAVINAIHAEGVRVAALAPAPEDGRPRSLFADSSDISFNFLKRLELLVSGLEVAESRYWEWEDAILGGFRIFDQLRTSRRGTVTVDSEERSLAFTPSVFVDLAGTVSGIGSASVATPMGGMPGGDGPAGTSGSDLARALAIREAILKALGVDHAEERDLEVLGWRGDLVDVAAAGEVQRAMWDRGVFAFRATTLRRAGHVDVTAIAIADHLSGT